MPWDHTIPIQKGKEVLFGLIYQMLAKELEKLRVYLDKNLAKRFIRKSQLLAGSSVLFVPKPNRKLWLVVDYCVLNIITTKDRYTLPLIHEMQDRFQGAVIFTKIDLCRTYNLVRIKEKEEWKTAFRTRYRYYKYTVMPIGLTNVPAL